MSIVPFGCSTRVTGCTRLGEYLLDLIGRLCSETTKLDRFWLEFSAVIPWLGGAESNEGIEVFGGAEGVHSQARG
jgi:hypothetical protein